jgi:cell division protein FtsA
MGMHGARLEVEAHIVTAATPALMNLTNCADTVGIQASDFVLGPLAAGEAVLDTSEKSMGVLVADIGGGTTDIALYVDGAAWHTKVIPVGGGHITNDIAMGLRVPFDVAERVKLQYGDCRPKEIDANFVFTVEPFSGEKIQVGRQDLAYVIEARVEEIFQLILREISSSGYDGLLPAGIVLTGGTAQLRGITDVASRVLGVSARVAQPRNLVGLVDALKGPAFATSVGLLRWNDTSSTVFRPRAQTGAWGQKIRTILGSLLPDRY